MLISSVHCAEWNEIPVSYSVTFPYICTFWQSLRGGAGWLQQEMQPWADTTEIGGSATVKSVNILSKKLFFQ